MKKHSIISIIVLAIIVTSCDYPIAMDYFGEVWINCDNNSDSDVWFSHENPNISNPTYEVDLYSREYFWGEGDERNHTHLVVWYGKTFFSQVKKNSNDNIFEMPTKNGWKWVKKYCYPDSLRIQVWDDALIQKVGWDEFVQGYGQKYKYELEYIIDLGHFTKDNHPNVTITYPPSGSEDFMRIVYPQPLE